MQKVAIIHHQPIEIFPPVLNCLDYLSSQSDQYKVEVFTTYTALQFKEYQAKNISIHRLYTAGPQNGRVKNIFNFFLFAVRVLKALIKFRPDIILYYESHSALPVYLYFKYFNSRARIFIHYHEYMTPLEYSANGMRLVNYSHKRESYLYKKAEWISHTNSKRVEMFLNDNKQVNKVKLRVLPNYPPADWNMGDRAITQVEEQPVKLVYVGSFGSLQHLYIKELLTWVKKNTGSLTLDIYTYNASMEVLDFVKELAAPNISMKGSLNYEELPQVLSKYKVGLIFYKATSLNVQHCAPNKLFEYIECGLDVWFSEEMLGCYDYIRESRFPKIIKVDFKNLDAFDYKKALCRKGITATDDRFSAEHVLSVMIDKFQKR